MKRIQHRCDHCGKWVAECQGFTLYDMANGHRESESVHICKKCSGSMVKGEWKQTYSPEYWYMWLDKRFPPGGDWEAGKYIKPAEVQS